MSAVHTVKHPRPVIVLEDESANESCGDFGSGPLPLPEGKPLGDSFAPQSTHPVILAGDADARAIVREAKPERHTWGVI